MTGPVSALVAATPATRDRFVDVVRMASLLGVVVGHFAMAAVTLDPAAGAVTVANVLEAAPWTRPLTLVFQVMPLFFVVGGFAHATAWRSLRARGGGYADFIHARVARLVRPALVLIGIWMGIALLAEAAWPDSPAVAPLLQIAGQLLWFIGIYLIAAAFAPVLLVAHERAPVVTLAALAGVAVAVDALRLGAGVAWVGWLNFAFVWLAIHQLGFAYADGVADRWGPRRVGGTMLVLGAAVLVALVVWGPYGVSMVSYAGEEVSNLAPPSVALLAFAVAQGGAVLLARGWIRALAGHRRVWTAVAVGGSVAMTVFLWHFTALVGIYAALWGLGVAVDGDPTDASFWWTKLAMLPAFLAAVTVLVLVFRRFDRPAVRGPLAGPSPVRAVIAALAAASAIAGMVGFAVTGFRGVLTGYTGHVAGVPVTAWGSAALVGASAVLAWAAVARPRLRVGGGRARLDI